MINGEVVKNIIKNEVKRGNKSFIIFPYGANGRLVKNILYDYFGINPVYIVDKEWSKYNSQIINVEELNKVYDNTQTVILTVEDRKLNRDLLEMLTSMIPRKNIINLLETKIFPITDFKPCNILPKYKKKIILPDYDEVFVRKIRVRFLFCNYSTFNTIESICEAFIADDRFELLIILGTIHENEDIDKYIRLLEEHKFQYKMISEYHVEEDIPDILIVSQPFDYKNRIDDLDQYVKLVIVASVMLISYAYSMNQFIDYMDKSFSRFKPDYYLFDSLLYREIRESGYDMNNIVEMGNAKFDGIWKLLQKREYPLQWKKLEGKKIIVWGVDHGVLNDGSLLQGFTFDVFAKSIFTWIEENPDIGLIFRPHDRLFAEFLENGIWTSNDYKDIVTYFNDSANMVLDLSPTYNIAFSIADGIITDATSGLSVSALAANKPLCLTYRSHDDIPIHVELSKSLYSAYSPEEAIDFINMIIENKDPRRDERILAQKRYIKNVDGHNGERIKNFIAEKYYEKIKDVK